MQIGIETTSDRDSAFEFEKRERAVGLAEFVQDKMEFTWGKGGRGFPLAFSVQVERGPDFDSGFTVAVFLDGGIQEWVLDPALSHQ